MAYSKTWVERFPKKSYGSFESGTSGSFSTAATSGSLLPSDMGFASTRSGERMPDYKQKIRDGLQASTPFVSDRSKIESMYETEKYLLVYSQKTFPFNCHRYRYEGIPFSMESPIVHLTTNSAKAKAIALTKIYKKIESELQHMSAPAFFAEFAEVCYQFGHPFQALVRHFHYYANKLESSKKKLIRKHVPVTKNRDGSAITPFSLIDRRYVTKNMKQEWLDILASTWLEMSFGLIPLLSDAESAAETLARWVSEVDISPKWRRKIQSRGEDQKSSSTYAGEFRLPPSGKQYYQLFNKRVTTARAQYTVGLSAPPIAPPGTMERLGQLYGITPANIIPAAYEAIPWSWLLDYFTNVQEILGAVFTSTAQVKWICLTESQKTELYYTTRWSSMLSYAPWTTDTMKRGSDAGSAKLVRTTLTRSIPTSLGVPSLYFEHPFENDKKVANMIAVLIARRSKNVALSDFMSASSPTIYIP